MPRRYHSIAMRLAMQSQDAALTAVQVFNNPQIKFKSETFIVLMDIAWTYLLHAHYRRKASNIATTDARASDGALNALAMGVSSTGP
jgi:Domain of unknown function (DUF3644)